ELVGLGTQFVVGQLLDLVGEGVHIVGESGVALELAAFAGPEQLVKNGHSLERPRGRGNLATGAADTLVRRSTLALPPLLTFRGRRAPWWYAPPSAHVGGPVRPRRSG